jgi:ribosomal-protein-alanine N-acetyltransferase
VITPIALVLIPIDRDEFRGSAVDGDSVVRSGCGRTESRTLWRGPITRGAGCAAHSGRCVRRSPCPWRVTVAAVAPVQVDLLGTEGRTSMETPSLYSPGVCVRQFVEEDLSAVVRAAEDPYVQALTGLVPGDPESVRAYVARQGLRAERGLGFSWAVVDWVSARTVGQIGLWMRAMAPDGSTGYIEEPHGRAALGYWVEPQSRRRGFARAALEAASTWALSLDEVDRLELFIEPANEASCRTAEAIGFQLEGLLRS